jgi:hypothetical protein
MVESTPKLIIIIALNHKQLIVAVNNNGFLIHDQLLHESSRQSCLKCGSTTVNIEN